jgi:hypothetical protein
MTAIAYWRFSRGDGIYDVPGQLIRAAGQGASRYIGNQVELSANWQASTILSVSASASLFRAGDFLRQTGPARPIRMVGTEIMFRF